MRNFSGAFTGIEAVIVLIAFVVVGAVLSYTVLSTGSSVTQNAQETIYKGVEQSTTNLRLMGNVYGLSNDSSKGISTITFCIGLAPGAPEVDLTKMNVVISTPSTAPVILTLSDYTAPKTADEITPGHEVKEVTAVYSGITDSHVKSIASQRTTPPEIITNTTIDPKEKTVMREYPNTFTAKVNGSATVYSMHSDQQVEIVFPTEYMAANTRVTIEIHPSAGAPLSFLKTVPATISPTNVLF